MQMKKTFTKGIKVIEDLENEEKLKMYNFLRLFKYHTHQTWPGGSMWQELSQHTTEDGLDPKVKVTVDVGNNKTTTKCSLLALQIWKLAIKQFET